MADDVREAQQDWRVHATLAQQAHDLVHIHRLAAGCRRSAHHCQLTMLTMLSRL